MNNLEWCDETERLYQGDPLFLVVQAGNRRFAIQTVWGEGKTFTLTDAPQSVRLFSTKKAAQLVADVWNMFPYSTTGQIKIVEVVSLANYIQVIRTDAEIEKGN